MEVKNDIYAIYDDTTIRVYQAYNPVIAQEALRLQTFGAHFSRTRMTWIKPSFLWMMYRCGWCSKENQEMVLALDIRREVFDGFLRQAVLSSAPEGISPAIWRQKIEASAVRVQWDPDRKPDGEPVGRRAIQMGIRGTALTQMLDGIVRIEDMTPLVKRLDAARQAGTLDSSELPQERLYPVTDPEIRKNLAMR